MWKLSTAFFPCSKEAFTRTPAPVLAAASLLCATPHCCCAEWASWGSREWSQGWSPPDHSWSPGWKGATPQAWEWGGHSGTCCGAVPNVSVSPCCAFAVIRTEPWGYWVNNELNVLEGSRGSLLLWHFWLKLAAFARTHPWPVTRASADPRAWPSLGHATRARKCNVCCGLGRSWKLTFYTILHFRRWNKLVLLLCVVWPMCARGTKERKTTPGQ